MVPTVVACVCVAGLVALFMCDRPERLGLGAYGEDPAAAQATAEREAEAAGRQGPVARAFGVLHEASRVPAFWALFATFFICGLSTNGLIQSHFISFCADYGLGETDAASVLAMMGVFDFFGTVASGWLSDRVDNRWLLFWYYGLRGLSLLWLPHSTFTFYGLSLFAMFYGLDWIATVPPTVRLTGKIFGREKAALVFGWVFTAHQIGAAVATYGAGAARTGLSTYLPAFYAAGAMCPGGGAGGLWGRQAEGRETRCGDLPRTAASLIGWASPRRCRAGSGSYVASRPPNRCPAPLWPTGLCRGGPLASCRGDCRIGRRQGRARAELDENALPWFNVVPVAADGSDLLEKLAWLKAHDAAAQEIGRAARSLVEGMTLEREIILARPTIAAALRGGT